MEWEKENAQIRTPTDTNIHHHNNNNESITAEHTTTEHRISRTDVMLCGTDTPKIIPKRHTNDKSKIITMTTFQTSSLLTSNLTRN